MTNTQRIALVVSLVLAVVALGVSLSTTSAPAVVAPQGLTFGTSNFGGDIDVAGSIKDSGVAFTGPIAFGTASTVISGTTIAHGLGTTPSAFVVQPAYAPSATYTQTLFGYGCGAITCAVGVSSGSVVTFTTVYWFAGK